MAKISNHKKEKITTIKVKIETKDRLNHLKEFERESYEELLQKLLYILNNLRVNPDAAQSILKNIDSKIKRNQAYAGIPQEKAAETGKNSETGNLQEKSAVKKMIPPRFVRK